MRPHVLKHRQSGFILIVVLAAVVLLSALLFSFNYTARAKLDATYSFYKVEQARNCARAGLNMAVAAIGDTNDLRADRRYSKLLTGEDSFRVGDGTCSVTIVEESGLLNINNLKSKSGQLDRTRIDQLLRLIDVSNRHKRSDRPIGYGIVPAIIDWTDPDNDVTHLPFVKQESVGAEEDYYRTCESPYHCRNRAMDTIDELRWVKGVTPEAFNHLRDLLTSLGDGRVNINAAPQPVIECLSEQMDSALAQMIVRRRHSRPFESAAELKDVPGVTDNIYQAIKGTITVRPQERFYRVMSQGDAENRSCRIEAVLRRNTQAGNVDIVLYREL